MGFTLLKNRGKIQNYSTINELVDISLPGQNTVDRKKYKILVIDDDGFAQEDGLKNLGFNDISVDFDFKDMNHIKAYDIILCDINGIATDTDSIFQGAALAKQIKEFYPTKIVIIFSAADQSLDFVEYYNCVDAVIMKNLSAASMANKLDNYIKLLENPVDRWKTIKNFLDNNGIQTKDIAVFEHYYVMSIKKGKDFSNEIEKYFNRNKKDYTKNLINIIPIVIPLIEEGIKNVIK